TYTALADSRPARRKADRVSHVALDAEGPVCTGERRTFRARRVELHALHLADPPVSRSRRAPRAPCGAAGFAGDGCPYGGRVCSRAPVPEMEDWAEELPEVARHTSEMERRAADA